MVVTESLKAFLRDCQVRAICRIVTVPYNRDRVARWLVAALAR